MFIDWSLISLHLKIENTRLFFEHYREIWYIYKIKCICSSFSLKNIQYMYFIAYKYKKMLKQIFESDQWSSRSSLSKLGKYRKISENPRFLNIFYTNNNGNLSFFVQNVKKMFNKFVLHYSRRPWGLQTSNFDTNNFI